MGNKKNNVSFEIFFVIIIISFIILSLTPWIEMAKEQKKENIEENKTFLGDENIEENETLLGDINNYISFMESDLEMSKNGEKTKILKEINDIKKEVEEKIKKRNINEKEREDYYKITNKIFLRYIALQKTEGKKEME